MSHSPFNGADFCEEGTGHFRSSGELIWKLIWNERKIIFGSCWPFIMPKDYLNIVLDEAVSLRRSCRNNSFPWFPQELGGDIN